MGKIINGLLIALGLYFLLVGAHRIWLPWVAGFLILEAPFEGAEMAVASTGSYERFRYAVDLVLQKKADRLLALGDKRIETIVPGMSPLDLAREEALEHGVPAEALIVRHSTSTLVDAKVASQVARKLNLKRVAVVSDVYNMRRLKMIFNQVGEGSLIHFSFVAPSTTRGLLHPEEWWRYPEDFEYVFKEWVKFPLDIFRIYFLAR